MKKKFKYDGKSRPTTDLYKKEFDKHRRFYLFNIKTYEIYELDINSPLIDKIVSLILDSKLTARERYTDEGFIENCKGPIQITDISNISESPELSHSRDIMDEYLLIDSDEE